MSDTTPEVSTTPQEKSFRKTTIKDGAYQLNSILGKGAYGKVYKGENTETGEVFAIKSIQRSAMANKIVPTVEREVELLKTLDHPNIVKLVDSFEETGHIYIIMELIDNHTLRSKMQDYGPLPEPLLAIYFSQIIEGVRYLHDQSIIHRDIKGENILLSKDGSIKLADFGSCTIQAPDINMTVVGTPYWMAPEIVEMTTGATTLSDIWSVGCTMLELATGKPPNYDLQPMAALYKIVTEDVPIPDHFSAELKDFLGLCFHKDPTKRATAAQLLEHDFVKSSIPKIAPTLEDLAGTIRAMNPTKPIPTIPNSVSSSISSLNHFKKPQLNLLQLIEYIQQVPNRNNVRFLVAVAKLEEAERINNLEHTHSTTDYAIRIYDKFLEEDSKYHLSVADEIRKETLDNIQQKAFSPAAIFNPVTKLLSKNQKITELTELNLEECLYSVTEKETRKEIQFLIALADLQDIDILTIELYKNIDTVIEIYNTFVEEGSKYEITKFKDIRRELLSDIQQVQNNNTKDYPAILDPAKNILIGEENLRLLDAQQQAEEEIKKPEYQRQNSRETFSRQNSGNITRQNSGNITRKNSGNITRQNSGDSLNRQESGDEFVWDFDTSFVIQDQEDEEINDILLMLNVKTSEEQTRELNEAQVMDFDDPMRGSGNWSDYNESLEDELPQEKGTPLGLTFSYEKPIQDKPRATTIGHESEAAELNRIALARKDHELLNELFVPTANITPITWQCIYSKFRGRLDKLQKIEIAAQSELFARQIKEIEKLDNQKLIDRSLLKLAQEKEFTETLVSQKKGKAKSEKTFKTNSKATTNLRKFERKASFASQSKAELKIFEKTESEKDKLELQKEGEELSNALESEYSEEQIALKVQHTHALFALTRAHLTELHNLQTQQLANLFDLTEEQRILRNSLIQQIIAAETQLFIKTKMAAKQKQLKKRESSLKKLQRATKESVQEELNEEQTKLKAERQELSDKTVEELSLEAEELSKARVNCTNELDMVQKQEMSDLTLSQTSILDKISKQKVSTTLEDINVKKKKRRWGIFSPNMSRLYK